MHAGRIIADSDDEEGLSPMQSPAKPTQERSSDKPSDATASTDPVFFQSVYLAQQHAVVTDAFRGVTGGSEGYFQHPGLLDGSFKETQDTLPELVSVHNAAIDGSRLEHEYEATSEKPTIEHDPWAMPSSPDMAEPTSKKKRKSTRVQAPDVIDLVSPDKHGSARTRKDRPKRSFDDEVGSENDDEDDLAMPIGEDGLYNIDRREGNQLYVEPSRMTESQKEEYENVGLSRLSPLDEPVSLSRNNHLVRSSGSATIAYPTPTQFRSNGAASASTFPPTAEVPSSDSEHATKRRRLSGLPATANPHSSPDIIAADFPGRTDRAYQFEPREEYVEPEDSYDQDWNEKDFGVPRQHEHKPGGQKCGQRVSTKNHLSAEEREGPAALSDVVQSMAADATTRIAAEPKKRGRPKKSANTNPKQAATAAAEDQRIESTPPQKKKRGRPKKSDKTIHENEDNPEPQAPSLLEAERKKKPLHTVDDGPKQKRQGDEEAGGKTKNGEEGESDNKEDLKPGSKILAETSENVAAATTAEMKAVTADVGTRQEIPRPQGHQGAVGKDKDGSNATTNAGLNAHATKPVYRVGLSKRTRIAPLLKCIRKD
ncbi:hypothetical protein jhhlp_001461 [Lomentospora prolificans]|uniref:AT hook domain-containing protein n=1 Tax=Lomentospora prolificans TaxID=41688 RepID=A0A2N3NIA3_9PEZI|nr:hypothetical protein jhhlp_001461 [Lomentospora prolificans]